MTGRRPPALPQGFGWLAPAVTAAAALIADLLPLTAGQGPLFTLCLVHAWALQAPERLPTPAVFVIGVVLDAVAGTPLGFTSLPLLLVHGGTVAARPFLVGAPFTVVWAAFALAALLGCGARWALAGLWWGHLFPLPPSLADAVLSVTAYPLVGWPVTRLQSSSRLGSHAAGG